MQGLSTACIARHVDHPRPSYPAAVPCYLASLTRRPLLPHTVGCCDVLLEAQTGRNVQVTARSVTVIAHVGYHCQGCMGFRGAVGPAGGRPMKLAVCIVGCGQFARTFVQALQPVRDDLDLFFASRDIARARAYAALFQGCGAFGSYAAAAADPRVEAMYLCTPHHLHQAHVALAAQAGKHILVEKPIARTLAEGRGIIAEAQRAGVTLMVAENARFMAAVRQCQALIAQGSVGDLRVVQFHEETPFQPGNWRSRRVLNGGGVFIDSGIHKVHLLRYLAGEPAHLYAAALPQALAQHEGEDGMVVMTRGASGVVGMIHHAWTSAQRPGPPWIAVSGTRGRIAFEMGAP